ncbi:MAG: tetratricopeptide repeat protein [Ignavibacteriota bacterium]
MIKIKIYLLAACLFFAFTAITSAQDDLQKGKDAISKGDFVTAVDALTKAVASKQNYETYYYYGFALYKTGSVQKAEDNLKKALAQDDEGIDAMITLGNIYSEQKKYDEANSLFKKGLKVEPDNINLMIAQANNLSVQSKIDDAIIVLTRATSFSKENPKVYVGLGDAYKIRGSYKLAIDYYKKAIALKKIPSAYAGLADCYAKQRMYNEAIVEYDNAINTDPNYADAYLGKGRILYFGNKYQEALEAFKKYSQLMPGSQEGNSYYAKTLYAQGSYYAERNQSEPANEKFNEALKMLNEVLKSDPRSITGNLYTAYIYTEKADLDEANKTEYLNKAIEFFNKVSIRDYDIEDLQKFAKVNTSLKSFDEAFKNYNMAVNKDSTDNDSETLYEWGKSLYKAEKYDEALEKFQMSIDLGNKNMFARLYKGFCYYSQKKYIEAVPEFQEVVKTDPKFLMAREFLARAYRFSNKNEESIKAYEEILQIDPEHKEALEMIKALNAKLKGN